MATASVTVHGDEQLRADLRGMVRHAHTLEPVLERQARRTAKAITGVARLTGELEKAIRAPGNLRVTNVGFEIGVGTFYGHMVFGGTSHSPAQPPRIPSSVGRETARQVGGYVVRHRHGSAW